VQFPVPLRVSEAAQTVVTQLSRPFHPRFLLFFCMSVLLRRKDGQRRRLLHPALIGVGIRILPGFIPQLLHFLPGDHPLPSFLHTPDRALGKAALKIFDAHLHRLGHFLQGIKHLRAVGSAVRILFRRGSQGTPLLSICIPIWIIVLFTPFHLQILRPLQNKAKEPAFRQDPLKSALPELFRPRFPLPLSAAFRRARPSANKKTPQVRHYEAGDAHIHIPWKVAFHNPLPYQQVEPSPGLRGPGDGDFLFQPRTIFHSCSSNRRTPSTTYGSFSAMLLASSRESAI